MWIPAHVTQFGWLVVIDVPASPTAQRPILSVPPCRDGEAMPNQAKRGERGCSVGSIAFVYARASFGKLAGLQRSRLRGETEVMRPHARTPASLAVARTHAPTVNSSLRCHGPVPPCHGPVPYAPTVNSSLRCHAMRNSRRISSPSAVSGRYAVRLHRWLRSHYGRCGPTCAEERRMPTKLVGPSTLGPDPRWSAWAGPCQAGFGSALH